LKEGSVKRIARLLSLLLLTLVVLSGHVKPGAIVDAQTGFHYYFPLVVVDPNDVRFNSIGPSGGTVTCIKIDPNNSDVVYAGTWGNGIYKSEDRGVTWTHISEGFQAGFVFDLSIDPKNSNHILASAYRFGVYESKDGGASWYRAGGMPDETVVYAIDFNPNNPSIVYAAVREATIYSPTLHYPGGVYKSINGGSNWFRMSNGLADDYVYDVAIDPNNVNVLYTAMHKTGVYKSIDGANTWFSVNNNIHYKDVRSIAINPDNSTIYAGMYDGKGVAISANGGASWTPLGSSLSQELYVYHLKLDPYDQKALYLATPTGLHRCTGNPYPVATSSCGLIAHSNVYVYDLALDEQSADSAGKITTIYTGLLDHGLYKSTDSGTSFAPSYIGIRANTIVSVLNDPTQPSILYASAFGRGLYKSTNAGQSWVPINTGLGSRNVNQLIFRPGNPNVIYAATQNAGIFITNNAGATWSSVNNGISAAGVQFDIVPETPSTAVFDHPTAYAWMDPVDIEAMRVGKDDPTTMEIFSGFPDILSIGIDPANPARMVAGTAGQGILKSDDYGATWSQSGVTSWNIYDFLVDPAQSLYTHYAGISGLGILASDNSRYGWTMTNTGMHSGVDVFGLDMIAPGKYYAATDSGIYRTDNAGGLWSPKGLSGIVLNDVLVDPTASNTVWAASSDGLYRSFNGGGLWRGVGYENLNNRFLTIADGYGESSVYFGMSGGNIYVIEP